MKSNGHAYDWLDKIQKRPSMYIRDGNDLSDIETMMHGYYIALEMHGIIEDVPSLKQFASWVYKRTGIGAALGWAHIIYEMHPDPETAFLKFFEYIEEYKHKA